MEHRRQKVFRRPPFSFPLFFTLKKRSGDPYLRPYVVRGDQNEIFADVGGWGEVQPIDPAQILPTEVVFFAQCDMECEQDGWVVTRVDIGTVDEVLTNAELVPFDNEILSQLW